MRRIAMAALCGWLLIAPVVWAQQPESAGARGGQEATGGEDGGKMEVFAWVNFALLAAGLVWIFRKNAVPYFAARAIGIRKGMIEAEDARAAAEQTMAGVDARLARLQTDIQALKDEATAAARTEHERTRQETADALDKIRKHARQEIESAGKSARLELKRYTAQLALGLAGQRIRARMNRTTQDALFRGFLHQLDSAPGARN